jgi:hypothetical protein
MEVYISGMMGSSRGLGMVKSKSKGHHKSSIITQESTHSCGSSFLVHSIT